MEDEDFDFSAPNTTRSRLSSLFQNENSSTPAEVNQALVFTAPKQPKKNDTTQDTAAALKLIHATTVHTFKLKDNNYTNQGKLGCAVLGHHETFTYKLLLYKSKQIQVNIVSITPNFNFHIQPNNYVNFYDDKKENWSVNFESEAALIEFTKQVTLAKINSQGKSLTSLVIQDLVKGAGQALENGDVAEVKYTGWLLCNFAFGQMFDSNMNSDALFRVRLGKGKVIKGLNEGMLGMQKGGKRLLIIPSDLAYGSEGMGSAVPPNSTLIFEVHLVKTKAGNEASHSPSPIKAPDIVIDKKPEVPPRQSFSQEDNIRMRGASISEQLTQSPKRDKAQLISRMAKMGMATLPFQGAVAAQVSSDSESEVDAPQPSSPASANISRTSSPKTFGKPRSRTDSGPIHSAQPVSDSMAIIVNQASSQLSPYAQPTMPSHQPFVCAAQPFPTYQHPMPGQFSVPPSLYSIPSASNIMTPVASGMSESHVSLLLSETRGQNMEVRMGLSKVTDKVDMVIQKVDELRMQGNNSVSKNMPSMDGAIILQNIERIIQENTRLKEDIEIKGSKIQSLNEIICDLFQRNSRLSEENGSIVGQNKEVFQIESAQSQDKISSLEQEKIKLELELSSTSSKLKKLDSDLVQCQTVENELNEKLGRSQNEAKHTLELYNATKEQLNETQRTVNSLEEKVKSLEHEKDVLEMKLQTIEREHTTAQGSSDLVEIYKKEIQDYKMKIEELNVIINDSVSSAKLEEEKREILLKLSENVHLKEELEVKVKEMKKKIDSFEDLKLSYEDKIRKLEAEVQNSQVLKRKYEVFQEKTRALKETYERQIGELINEKKRLENNKSETSQDFSAEIKRVMNKLYKVLDNEFEPDTSYSGSQVLKTVVNSIRSLTFQMLEGKKQSFSDPSGAPQLSDKTVEKEEMPLSEELNQHEFSRHNGDGESEVKPSSSMSETLVSSPPCTVDNNNKDTDTPSDNNQDSLKSEIEELSEINAEKKTVDEIEKNPSGNESSHTLQRESPESNAQQPLSNLFSESLSTAEGTKILRPQPPPFFDDDDDDDDDDDWLK